MTRRGQFKLVVLAFVLAVIALRAESALADRAKARNLVSEGDAFSKRNKTELALARYRKAIVEDPDYLPAYEAVMRHWATQGEFAQLASTLEAATLRHPDYARGWYGLAYAYRKLGRWNLAALAYESYIQLRPSEAAPFFGLAMAQKRSGNLPAARVAFERYLALEKDPTQGEYVAQAKRELEALNDAPPLDPLAPRTVALASPRLGDRPHAGIVEWFLEHRLASADMAAQSAPARDDDAEATIWLVRGQIAMHRGQFARAKSLLLVALGFAPTRAEIYRAMAALQQTTGDSDKAMYFTELASHWAR